MDRTDRVDALLSHLRANHYATMTELAAELGVSVRTVRRDIADLRLRGIDIEGERGRGGGVRFARLAPLPPLRLDESQVVALWLSVQLARRATGLPFSDDSGAALNKVLAALPESRRQKLRQLCARIVVGPPASARMRETAGEMCPTLLENFERCFNRETCLSFTYRDRVGKTTQRRIEPHGILVQPPVWYILSVDVDKGEPRMFRMDRIANPRPFSRAFVPSRAVVHECVRDVPGVQLPKS